MRTEVHLTAGESDNVCDAGVEYWPAHLSKPSPRGWALWRDFVLRGTGFPASLVRSFTAHDLARAAKHLDEVERVVRTTQAIADEWLTREISELLAAARTGSHPDRSDNGWPAALKFLRRASNQVRQHEISKTQEDLLPVRVYEPWRDALAELSYARGAYAQAYKDAVGPLSDALRRVAAEPTFREAIVWQNHSALAQAIDPLAMNLPMSGARRKQREALLANYVQRYCTKNDTIGFFGPMAWCRVVPPKWPSGYSVGRTLVGTRVVRFEDWTIATLAETLIDDEALLPWLIPRVQPFLRIEGSRIFFPGGRTVDLDPAQAQLLAECNGVRTVKTIAERLLTNPYSNFANHDDVLLKIRELERVARLHLGFQVSSCDGDPEVALRSHLMKITDDAARNAALKRLDMIELARSRVASAAGDPSSLLLAMSSLDRTFVELTGANARRRHGEAYGGRSLTYEDCHRNVKLTLSEEALAPLQEALDLVLASAGWFTRQAADLYAAEFEKIFRQSAPEVIDQPSSIALVDFWLRAHPALFDDNVILDELSRDLHARWEVIFAPFLADGARHVQIPVEAVQNSITLAFPQAPSQWALGRYQSPDIMFCAASPDALARGEYLAVLGEIHVGGNTLITNGFASLHPQPDALRAAVRRDLGVPYVMPRLSPMASATPIRTQLLDDPEACVEILFSQNSTPCNPAMALRAADLLIVRQGEELLVKSRNGDATFSLLDALGDFLFLAIANRFSLTARRGHSPRITLGCLVLQRESWRFGLSELVGILRGGDSEDFRFLLRWATDHGMPPTVFVKASWEKKPFYVDFESPIYSRLLAKQLRNAIESESFAAETLIFSEMVPSFDDLWLLDKDGHTYTSELRFVAIHKDDVT